MHFMQDYIQEVRIGFKPFSKSSFHILPASKQFKLAHEDKLSL